MELSRKIFLAKYKGIENPEHTCNDADGDRMYEESIAFMSSQLWAKCKRLRTEYREVVDGSENFPPYPNLTNYTTEIPTTEYIPYVELTREKIESLLSNRSIVLGGSIMYALLHPDKLVSMSNCFVIPSPHDSYSGILKSDSELANIMKRRGGVGLDISTLRAEGTPVNNAALTSTGAVSFMDRFSNTTREVAQNGRRGALMLSMDIRHPDIEKFIDKKSDRTSCTGANISVRLDDEFVTEALMHAEGKEHKLLEKIADSMIKHAEPGVLMWGNVEEPNEHVEVKPRKGKRDPFKGHAWNKLETTNPCGEIPLSAYETCKLIHVNLGCDYILEAAGNQEELRKRITELSIYAAMLGDAVIEIENDKVSSIIVALDSERRQMESRYSHVLDNEIEMWEVVRAKNKLLRRIGIGVMGFADLECEMRYQLKKQGYDFVHPFFKDMDTPATRTMLVMKAFSLGVSTVQQLCKYDMERCVGLVRGYPVRFLFSTAIAPTGTTALIAGVSHAMEPIYAPYYTRKVKVNDDNTDGLATFTDEFGDTWYNETIIHPYVTRFCDRQGIPNPTTQQIDEVCKKHGIRAAHDYSFHERILTQEIAQRFVNQSISSTVNIRAGELTPELLADHILGAYKRKLKGFTIYVDGSRDNVITSGHTVTECPNCGSKNIQHTNGCSLCMDCQTSACSI